MKRFLVVGTKANYNAWLKKEGRNSLSPYNPHMVEARYLKGWLGSPEAILVLLDREYPTAIGKVVAEWIECGGKIRDLTAEYDKD